MAANTPPSGEIQPIPFSVVRDVSPEMAWKTHRALLNAMIEDPKLLQDPMFQHFMNTAYVRFEQALGVAQ